MTYREFCNLKSNDPKENIFPKGTEPEEAMDILEETFVFYDDHKLYEENKHIMDSDYPTITKFILCNLSMEMKKFNKERFNNIITTVGNDATAQESIDLLRKELIPEDWYISYPCGYAQANTEIVGEILRLYNNPDTKLINRIKAFFKKKK